MSIVFLHLPGLSVIDPDSPNTVGSRRPARLRCTIYALDDVPSRPWALTSRVPVCSFIEHVYLYCFRFNTCFAKSVADGPGLICTVPLDCGCSLISETAPALHSSLSSAPTTTLPPYQVEGTRRKEEVPVGACGFWPLVSGGLSSVKSSSVHGVTKKKGGDSRHG